MFNKGHIYYLLENKVARSTIPCTYQELVEIRKDGKLIPGTEYRITDYIATTTMAGTESAGHNFDIIVTADSAYTLNENARACQHSEDTYFSNCNLEAWEIKYCLDNDTSRFSWADSNVSVESITDTIGNVYYYNSSAIWNGNEPNYIYLWKSEIQTFADGELVEGYVATTTRTPAEGDSIHEVYTEDKSLTISDAISSISSVTETISGKGVIYYMKDEYGNEFGYDFKNIQFALYKANNFNSGSPYSNQINLLTNTNSIGVDPNDNGYKVYSNGSVTKRFYVYEFKRTGTYTYFTYEQDPVYFYTLSNYSDKTDASVNGSAKGNKCLRLTSDLNPNVCIYTSDFNTNHHGIDYDPGCYNNVAYNPACIHLKGGKSSYSNTFFYGCDSLTFNSGAYMNYFGEGCNDCNFSAECETNFFVGHFKWNIVGYLWGNFIGHYIRNSVFDQFYLNRIIGQLDTTESNSKIQQVSFSNINTGSTFDLQSGGYQLKFEQIINSTITASEHVSNISVLVLQSQECNLDDVSEHEGWVIISENPKYYRIENYKVTEEDINNALNLS